jgi:hypothetical protein
MEDGVKFKKKGDEMSGGENYDIKMLNIKDLAKMVLYERPCY